ncbi:UrcA family protein [Phenylobacterium sp.]|jgi:UrcA family protein|uniref:UrcA family protein n=1 Tax=Phenylobacterium sp. TaxID=1871053 RepID=UPI0037835F82
MPKMVFSAVASVLLLGASAAQAQDDRMVVKISDVNTSSMAGAATVLSRVDRAARVFCGERDLRDLGRSYLILRCRREMTGKAVVKIDRPMVTALYEQVQPTIILASR